MDGIENYEVLVIGSGEAGKYLAWTFAKAGYRTALVERKMIGGSCPNVACLPSKNVIHSAKVASLAARGTEFGIETISATTNMEGVRQRKGKMVENLIKVHLDRYEVSGTELIMGEARFVAPQTVEVNLNDGGTRTLSEPRGFIKMLLDAESDGILGITVFGAEASEMMATVQTAMLGELPFTVLRDAIFTHPTTAEGLTYLLADTPAKTM